MKILILLVEKVTALNYQRNAREIVIHLSGLELASILFISVYNSLFYMKIRPMENEYLHNLHRTAIIQRENAKQLCLNLAESM